VRGSDIVAMAKTHAAHCFNRNRLTKSSFKIFSSGLYSLP